MDSDQSHASCHRDSQPTRRSDHWKKPRPPFLMTCTDAAEGAGLGDDADFKSHVVN